MLVEGNRKFSDQQLHIQPPNTKIRTTAEHTCQKTTKIIMHISLIMYNYGSCVIVRNHWIVIYWVDSVITFYNILCHLLKTFWLII